MLSSAGLVYKFYGKEVIDQICKTEYGRELDEKIIDKLHQQLYKKIILEIDCNDTGVEVADEMNYHINSSLPS